jgi:hypothetical protein
LKVGTYIYIRIASGNPKAWGYARG